MLSRVVFLLAALAALALPARAADPTSALSPALTAQLGSIVAKHKVPGLAALALRGDTVIAEFCQGVRKLGDSTPLTPTDRFHLGSDTKAMTATLAALLVEEGRLAWQTTPADAFARAIPKLHPDWKSVTLVQLLTHRGGLRPNHGYGFHRDFEDSSLPRQRVTLATEILVRPPDHSPGSRYVYSNSGYAIAGTMLEQATGRAWEDLMRERLFAPLGIVSGGFGAPGASGPVTQPWGHTSDGGPIDPSWRAADNAPTMGPAGTVHMTMRDWARFITLHLRGHAANPHHHAALLLPADFAVLHTPAAGEHYAGGWSITTRPWANGHRDGDTGRVLSHAGSNTVWYCVAWLAPEIDFAVLVACNEGGAAATKACDETAGALITVHAQSVPTTSP